MHNFRLLQNQCPIVLFFLSAAAGDTMQRIIQAAVSAGYQVRWRLLNAGCYGLAEVRRDKCTHRNGCRASALTAATKSSPLLLLCLAAPQPTMCVHRFLLRPCVQHRRRLIVLFARHDVPLPSFPLPYTLFPGAGGYQEPGQPCLLEVRLRAIGLVDSHGVGWASEPALGARLTLCSPVFTPLFPAFHFSFLLRTARSAHTAACRSPGAHTWWCRMPPRCRPSPLAMCWTTCLARRQQLMWRLNMTRSRSATTLPACAGAVPAIQLGSKSKSKAANVQATSPTSRRLPPATNALFSAMLLPSITTRSPGSERPACVAQIVFIYYF